MERVTERSSINLVVLGYGYSAAAFVDLLKPERCFGTTRSAEKAATMDARGVNPIIVGDSFSPALSRAIRDASHILVSAAPDEAGDPFFGAFADDLAGAHDLAWVGYLSTIGVYGDHGGGTVTEDSDCLATSARGKWRITAEAAWARLTGRIGVPLGTFRLAGIYGPGRNTLLSLQRGKAKRIVKPGQVFNRIHVDDIAATLLAAINDPRDRIYNVSDDEAAPPQDVVTFAAELMGVAPPPEVPFDEAELSPMARSFYGDVKRVSNARIRDELGVRLRYPTYREGLRALYQSGEGGT
ncbi:MAG: SDR family oxidoreductase [Pseudomonadota bacterium]